MKCIEINHGELNTVIRPLPKPVAGEVLTKVAAADVNHLDILQFKGVYITLPVTSDIPGLEIAGTLEALGTGVTDLAVGEEVMALVTGEGYAQYCNAPAPQCRPIPSTLKMDEAANVKTPDYPGSTLRAQSVEFKADIGSKLKQKICPFIEARKILSFIHATFPLCAAAEALELMARSEHISKIVLMT
jgi:NADPH:quinone reductase-like Zn-dependent oxidoreductase